jgi:tetratricopeptide (TPR) repeat protein
VTGQLEEQLQSDRLWTGTYPRDYVAFASLGTAYGIAGQYEKGLQASLEALRLDPGGVSPYVNAMGYYAALGRADEAKRIYYEARKRNISPQHLPVYYYDVAFVHRDSAAMAEAATAALGNEGAQDEILLEMALVEAYAGKLQKARELFSRAAKAAPRTDGGHSIALTYVTRAHVEALFGLNREAQADAIEALKLASERDLLAVAGWSLARAGNTSRAEKAEQLLRSRYPLHTIVNRVYVPALRAEIENSRNREDLAIDALQAAVPYELTSSGGSRNMYAVFVRGESYLRARKSVEAQLEFQKILDRPGVVMNSPLTPLARLGQARAYALAGETAKSRKAYEDYFTMWNEADTDLPILVRAKRDFAALK